MNDDREAGLFENLPSKGAFEVLSLLYMPPGDVPVPGRKLTLRARRKRSRRPSRKIAAPTHTSARRVVFTS